MNKKTVGGLEGRRRKNRKDEECRGVGDAWRFSRYTLNCDYFRFPLSLILYIFSSGLVNFHYRNYLEIFIRSPLVYLF